jgi:hypothetical protein
MILESDHMKVQSTNLLHLLILNILKINVINVHIIWFTAQYHPYHLWGRGPWGLGTAVLKYTMGQLLQVAGISRARTMNTNERCCKTPAYDVGHFISSQMYSHEI